jgi:hypothetical protein
MSRSRKAIVRSFLNHEANSNYNSLSTDGKTLYSYSTPIAYFSSEHGLVIRNLKYSSTTSRQLNELRNQVDTMRISYKTQHPVGNYWYLHHIEWSEPK